MDQTENSEEITKFIVTNCLSIVKFVKRNKLLNAQFIDFVKKVFLKILQNSQENTYAKVLFPFGLFSIISKVSVADFEDVFVCWERYGTAIVVV